MGTQSIPNEWVRQSYAWVFEKKSLTEHPATWARVSPALCRIRSRALKLAPQQLIELHLPMSCANTLPTTVEGAVQRRYFPHTGRGIRLNVRGRVADLEYEWFVPQMIREVSLQYSVVNGVAHSPASKDTRLEWHDGRRWCACPVRRIHVDDVERWAGRETHTFYLIPRASARFRIRISGMSSRHPVELLNVDLREMPDFKGWAPGEQRSGNMPYMGESEPWRPEPDAASMRALALPRYLPAMLGNVDGTAQASMAFNGMLYRLAGPRAAPHQADLLLSWFALGEPPVMFGDTWMVRRGVAGHGLGAWMEEVRQPLKVRVEAVPNLGSPRVTSGLQVVVKLENLERQTVESWFMVGHAISASYVGPYVAGLLNPDNRVGWKPVLSADGRRLDDGNGNVILEADVPFALIGAGTDWGVIRRLRIEPRGRMFLRLFLPDLAPRGRGLGRSGITRPRLLRPMVRMQTPNGEFADRYRHLLEQQLCGIIRRKNRTVMPYGSETSMYRECLFGVEEHYSCQALALYGFADLAGRIFRDTFLGGFYKAENNLHIAYRLGVRAASAMTLYRLSRKRTFLQEVEPTFSDLLKFVETQVAATQNDPNPLFRGLFPEGWYGGDLRSQRARSVYNVTAAIQGLYAAAAGWQSLGRHGDSARAKMLAEGLRTRLTRALTQAFRANVPRPYLPLNLLDHGDRPASGDYYGLFANLVLETGVYPPGTVIGNWITDYLERDYREFLGLARFGNGHDAVYSIGFLRYLLNSGQADRYLMGVLAYLHLAMDDEVWTAPEVGNLPQKRSLSPGYYAKLLLQRPAAPLLAGSAVGLILIRHLFIHENLNAEGLPDGTLTLLPAVPREWLAGSGAFSIGQWPSAFGGVSLRRTSVRNGLRLDIEMENPGAVRELRIPIRLPASLTLRPADVSGPAGFTATPIVGADSTIVLIPRPGRRTTLHCRYASRTKRTLRSAKIIKKSY